MKLKLTILALLSLITAVIAGDAEMKQQLVGTWKDADTRTTIVLKSDGTRLVSGNDFSSGKPFFISGKWDVKDGDFVEVRPSPEVDRTYTIISITQHKFVLRDNGHGRHTGTWTR
jgi:hypothetical protein